MKDLAVFGGSFNPPGRHHRRIAEELSRYFDEVLVVPCGPRPDKPVTNNIAPVHRAALVDLNFQGLPKVQVDLFDLEASTFTRTYDLDQHFAPRGHVWHVVGSDLIVGGGRGQSAIQQQWQHGQALWQNARFAVLHRPGYQLAADDLPPHHRLVPLEVEGASSDIRSRIFHGQPVEDGLLPQVAAYVERHGLYRGGNIVRQASLTVDQPRLLIVADERNARAVELAARLEPFAADDANLIAVVGGDGTMLRAIRQHWRRRIPFFGCNAGHLGFLLNEGTPLDAQRSPLLLAHVPLLFAEAEKPDGQRQTALAFNDCWVERATGQTAWIEVKVNGQPRLNQLIGDGALIATAAGSTAYARAMGAAPLPLGTPALLLVGSNVLRPAFWKPVVLPIDSQVELTTLDPVKRPLEGFIDGVSQGIVKRLSARVSNIAAAELVYLPEHDPAARLASIQFPT